MTTPGGSRKGAGRKAKDGAKDVQQVIVFLTAHHIARARELSLEVDVRPNITLGIRRALNKYICEVDEKD